MAVAYGQMGIHAREEYIVLGLDPGRDKTGFAFVDKEGGLLASGIFPSSESDDFFRAVVSDRKDLAKFIIEGTLQEITSCVKFIVIGNGTHSKDFTDRVKAVFSCEVLTVDEKNTTLEARGLYWKIHAPSFWMRLIPEGLRVPKRMLDDLAAWSIALRGLKKYRDINQNKL